MQQTNCYRMANVFTILVIAGLVAAATACNGPSASGGVGWEIDDGVRVGPWYDPGSGAVGGAIEIQFKRSASQTDRERFFSVLDQNGDGLISLDEWIATGGKWVNFADFVKDKDTNSDDKISWQEFGAVTTVYTNRKAPPKASP